MKLTPKYIVPIVVGVVVVVLLAITLKMFVFKSTEERIPGTWAVTDVKVEAENLDADRVESLKRIQESVYFVLNEDMSFTAFTGDIQLTGTWSFDKNRAEVFARFDGDKGQASLLGKWESGKLVKIHKSAEAIITTTYEKE